MFARAATRAFAHRARARPSGTTTTTGMTSATLARACARALARAASGTSASPSTSSPVRAHRSSSRARAVGDASWSPATVTVTRARASSRAAVTATRRASTTTARAGRWEDDLYDDDFDDDENPWADDDDDEFDDDGGNLDASSHKDALRGVGGPRVRDELPLPPKGTDTTPPRPVTRDDVTISFARSGGAGGQNVNKVNTKVDMRLNVDGAVAAGWLPRWCADRLVVAEKNRMNNDGELVVNSTRHRTQSKNVDDALEKLQSYINRAAKLPGNKSDKQKKKKLQANVEKGNKRRLQDKKQTSEKKSSRRAGKNIKNFDDY